MPLEKYAAGHLYESVAYEDRKSIIDFAVANLALMTDKFDAIAVTGLSGLLIGPSIADRLGKNVIAIRKKFDKSHSDYIFEGVHSDNYVIVDDFSSSGETLYYIDYNVKKQLPKAKLVALYCYNDGGLKDETYIKNKILSYIKGNVAYHQQKCRLLLA